MKKKSGQAVKQSAVENFPAFRLRIPVLALRFRH
jgi:hypothetical protein